MSNERTWTEEIMVTNQQLFGALRKLVREVTVRKISVLKPDGDVLFEIPLYYGFTPLLLPFTIPYVALATGAAYLAHYRIQIVREGAPEAEEMAPVTVTAEDIDAAETEEEAAIRQMVESALDGEEAEAEAEAAEAAALATAEANDLTAIKGIGPSMVKALAGLGITTFADLAAADPGALKQQLRDAGVRAPADTASWVEQARGMG